MRQLVLQAKQRLIAAPFGKKPGRAPAGPRDRESDIEALLHQAWSECQSAARQDGDDVSHWNPETAADYLIGYAEGRPEYRELGISQGELDKYAEAFINKVQSR